MKKLTFRVLSLMAVAGASSAFGQIMITASGTYTESFAIAATATASLPSGWTAAKSATARDSNFSFAAGATATEQLGGTSMSTTATNGVYNFGAGAAGSAADRAVGFLSSSSSTKTGFLMAQFQNNGAQSIDSLTVSYDVERYRNGSNAAGFSVQLFYSINGTSWSSAGSSFLTSFSSNSDNSGLTTVPAETKSISGSLFTLPSSVSSGANFYLAWQYSVSTGTTTSNAQALGIDNVTIIAATSPVPEPSSFAALAGLGALGFCALRRRRLA